MRVKHTLPGRAARARIPFMLTIAIALCAAVLLAMTPASFAAAAAPNAPATEHQPFGYFVLAFFTNSFV